LRGHPYTLIDTQVGDQHRSEGLLHQFLWKKWHCKYGVS